MAEDGRKTNLTKTKEGGKASCKSANITATPTRGTINAVTPNAKQTKEQEQDSLKILGNNMKKGLKAYFGAGKRIPASSKDRNPISTVLQRRDGQGNAPRKKNGSNVEPSAEKEGEGDKNNTVRSTSNTKKGTKALRKESARNEEHQNKKPRSADEGSGGEDSKQVRKGSDKKGRGQGGSMVNLESMRASMKKKGSGTQAAKKKAAMKKKEDSVDKTKGRKKKSTFAEPDLLEITSCASCTSIQ